MLPTALNPSPAAPNAIASVYEAIAAATFPTFVLSILSAAPDIFFKPSNVFSRKLFPPISDVRPSKAAVAKPATAPSASAD